ncbi:hypothetical protein [Chitinimonas prasina]|uniref:hypothetical protein n=1 Tax=Chitinimonas prasina TaxID=1434937 RepID=UPI0024E053C7|nr:hypothetical protein [Chitinimonas prasina]
MSEVLSSHDSIRAHLYSIRLLIRHPRLSVSSISEGLGVSPTHSWDVNDVNRPSTMWSLQTWTEGERYFFDEIGDVVCWLEGRLDFVRAVIESGGKVDLIAQLPGCLNIGDLLCPETMARASKIGIAIGVEVFPNLRREQKGVSKPKYNK